MASIEQRLRRLEDEAAIKVLKARYCEFCDNDYDPDGIASLFIETGVWDGGFMGRFEGREAIRTHFQGTSTVMGFAIHHVTNPIIEIDTDTASGQWYLWQPCTQTKSNRGIWLAARYRETYKRTDAGWRFDQMIIDPKMFAPYEGGWAETTFVAGGPRSDA
jgi:hypothetical protein